MHISTDGIKKTNTFDNKHIYSVKEAAEALGVHTNTIYRLCRSGKLGAYRAIEGGEWYIPGKSLNELRVPPPSKRVGAKSKKQLPAQEGGTE